MDDTTQNGRIYVKFGPRDTEEMPLQWAEKMLTELKRVNPALFGRLAQMAMGIEPRSRS